MASARAPLPLARLAAAAAARRRRRAARARCAPFAACARGWADALADDASGVGSGERGVWSVVVPTYERLPILRKCLRAMCREGLHLRQGTARGRAPSAEGGELGALQWAPLEALEVVVVDDGSSDGTVDWIEAELRGGGLPGDMVRLVKMGSNGGATRARNVGIRASRGAVVVFIDSDLLVAEGFLAAHARALDAAWDADGGLDAAFTYGRVVNTDNFEQPESEPFKLTDRSAAFFATGNVAVSRARLAGACALLPPQQHEQQCGGLRKYPDGADAGPFDAQFSSYGWEDLELGERLRALGARIAHTPEAVGYHYHPALTPAQLPGLMETERQRGANGAKFLARHPNLRVALMTQLTPLHAALWLALTLGGLLSAALYIPVARTLCAAGRPRTAMAVLSPALNWRCVRAAFAEATAMARRAVAARLRRLWSGEFGGPPALTRPSRSIE